MAAPKIELYARVMGQVVVITTAYSFFYHANGAEFTDLRQLEQENAFRKLLLDKDDERMFLFFDTFFVNWSVESMVIRERTITLYFAQDAPIVKILKDMEDHLKSIDLSFQIHITV